MAEREHNSKIVAFVEDPSGVSQRFEIICKGPDFLCLREEVWSGEGIDSVAGRLLRTEAEINIPVNSKINCYFEGNCNECSLKKSSDQ